MKTDFCFHTDLVCTEYIRGYGNWGYNDWNRWREEQGMLCRCLNFSDLLIMFSKDESRNMWHMPNVKFQLHRNDITLHFLLFPRWWQHCCPGPPKTVGWTPILNAPTRTSTSRSTKTGQIQKFWFTRPSLTSSSATREKTNIIIIRNNLNFKITS